MAKARRNVRQPVRAAVPPAPAPAPTTSGVPAPADGESRGRWITSLVVSAIIGPLVVFLLVREGGPLNRKDPAALGGNISRVTLVGPDPCCSFSVKFALDGFKGRVATVDAIVTDAHSRRTAAPLTVKRAVAGADKDEVSFTAGVPMSGYPPSDYVVTFVLNSPDGTELDRRDSEEVTVP